MQKFFPLRVVLLIGAPDAKVRSSFVVGRAVCPRRPNNASCFIATVVQQANRKRRKERTVDALALGGDEGRGKLRKASGRCKQPLIRRYPNEATQLVEDQLSSNG